MTAAARSNSRRPISPEQRRAIFAAAHAKGKSTDDIRAMCPRGSISALSYYEAWDVLNRINGKPPRSTGWNRGGPRERREPGILGPRTPEQLELIRLHRIALGWMPSGLHAHLDERTYPSDPVRKMTDIKTTHDAQAVIEHLKIVLSRTLFYHAKRLGRPIAEDHDIKESMRSLPPHERLTELLMKRAEQVSHIKGMDKAGLDEWIARQRFRDGRYMSCAATCSDVVYVIDRIEKEIPLESPRPAPQNPEPAESEADEPPAVLARIGGTR